MQDENTFSIIVDGDTVSYFIQLDDQNEKHIIDYPIARDENSGRLFVPIDCFYYLTRLMLKGWKLDELVVEKTEKGD